MYVRLCEGIILIYVCASAVEHYVMGYHFFAFLRVKDQIDMEVA
ncbi:unnamed protein product [Cuscuta epithymum]|uniref:Uncharacterized protein n=1 Tax=Cuscuta epithymum TaxID=186058 RepID=A0AAV0FIG7_9ASTE|nr:unnamed protein product [Cuscuta epithymum]